MKPLQAFRRCDDSHEFDLFSAVLFEKSTAETADPPVASMGSVTMMVRSSMGLGSLQ